MRQPPALRLFIGLWPEAAGVRDALQAHADGWSWPAAARRTPVERLHLTVQFLGAVAPERLGALQQGLRVAWAGCELVLDRATVWPGGIAVLEAGVVPPALTQLHQDLTMKLRTLGLPVEERPYRPHVTLARKAHGAQPPAARAPVHWRAGRRVLLVQSLPGGQGYQPLAALA